jgi:thioredoxin family protein
VCGGQSGTRPPAGDTAYSSCTLCARTRYCSLDVLVNRSSLCCPGVCSVRLPATLFYIQCATLSTIYCRLHYTDIPLPCSDCLCNLIFCCFQEYPNAVFMLVDTDHCQQTASSFRISAIPTFYFYINGSETLFLLLFSVSVMSFSLFLS